MALIQGASSAVLFAIWWLARPPRRASTTGFAIACAFLLQLVALSGTLGLRNAVEVSYLAAAAPMVGAVTQRARGLLLTGAAGMLALAVMVLSRPTSDGVNAWQSYIPAFFFFVTVWAIGLFASAASERAVREHALDEQRAQAAQALAKETEARYQLVVEHMSDLISVLDEQGRYVFVSPSY
ncbi:MAG TPA: PAS domain-containing protein, partial [Polyangiaceae bacterium]|nr:PAS domain-containing protein [Polyangiaceae bacterium]